MPQQSAITPEESIAVIEVTGMIALARLLQTLGVETRARTVGATDANAAGVTTVVIAGGLAEVQHAASHVKTLSGVTDSIFFAKPDPTATDLLLRSLHLAESARPKQEVQPVYHQRVRSVEELDVADIENWNVHELRRYARTIEGFPLKGRMISKANRPELLSLFEQVGVTLRPSFGSIYSQAQQTPN